MPLPASPAGKLPSSKLPAGPSFELPARFPQNLKLVHDSLDDRRTVAIGHNRTEVLKLLLQARDSGLLGTLSFRSGTVLDTSRAD